jgi:hypothetical protein
MIALDASFEKDAERRALGQTEHTASALRLRALRQKNGYQKYPKLHHVYGDLPHEQ